MNECGQVADFNLTTLVCRKAGNKMKVAGIEIPQIRQSDFTRLLANPHKRNIFVYGKSGIGKTQTLIDYAKAHKKKLKGISLATMIPEFIGGVPYAKVSSDKKTEYFTLLLMDELQEIFDDEGEDWIIFFDEMNQAPTEVMNALYSICHIKPEQRNWCGHSLAKVQIVGAGNLMDGSDGTVYLNEIPTPLARRFHNYELVSSAKDVTDYLKKKYKNIPQVGKYITVMLDNNIAPRDIDECLDIIQFDEDPLFLQDKLGTALTAKLLDMQKGIKNLDPAERLKNVKKLYKIFQEDGIVTWGPDTINTEEELIEKFKEILTDEELASVLKGGE